MERNNNLDPDNQSKPVVYIIDSTYGRFPEIDETEFNRFKTELEKEFAQTFEEVSVEPAADLPAFATAIDFISDYWPGLMFAFLSAKPIRENWKIWIEVAGKIRRYFTREDIFLNREAAGVLAIHAVLDDFNDLPLKMECISYHWIHRWFEKKEDISDQWGIHSGPDDSHISVAIHVFRIKADHLEYEVTVVHKSVSLKRL